MTQGAREQKAKACLEALAKDRPGAMDDLMALVGAPVAALLYRFVGSDSLAQDCAQDVFITVWQKSGTFDPAKGTAMAWIYTIARNKARDALRRRRLRQVVGLEPLGADTLPADQPDADQTISGRQSLDRTRAAISALPDRQRLAILMSTVAELETKAIAEAMGLSVGAVDQLLFRARRTLRMQLLGDET